MPAPLSSSWGVPEIDATPLLQDPCHAWMEAHPEEVAPHLGRQVAVHPTRGVVASAATLDELVDELERAGITQDADLLLTAVPSPRSVW